MPTKRALTGAAARRARKAAASGASVHAALHAADGPPSIPVRRPDLAPHPTTLESTTTTSTDEAGCSTDPVVETGVDDADEFSEEEDCRRLSGAYSEQHLAKAGVGIECEESAAMFVAAGGFDGHEFRGARARFVRDGDELQRKRQEWRKLVTLLHQETTPTFIRSVCVHLPRNVSPAAQALRRACDNASVEFQSLYTDWERSRELYGSIVSLTCLRCSENLAYCRCVLECADCGYAVPLRQGRYLGTRRIPYACECFPANVTDTEPMVCDEWETYWQSREMCSSERCAYPYM